MKSSRYYLKPNNGIFAGIASATKTKCELRYYQEFQLVIAVIDVLSIQLAANATVPEIWLFIHSCHNGSRTVLLPVNVRDSRPDSHKRLFTARQHA